jgi:hypothetical protein
MNQGRYLKLVFDRQGRSPVKESLTKYVFRSVVHTLIVGQGPRYHVWTKQRKTDLDTFLGYTRIPITKEEFWSEFNKAIDYLRNFEKYDINKFKEE